MLRRLLHLLAVIAGIASAASAQSKFGAQNPFQLDIDFARFYGDSTQIYLEMYYGIHENMLTYRVDSGRYVGAANLSWVIRSDSAVVAKKEWTVPHLIDDTARLQRPQSMIGLESVGLPAGDYRMVVQGYDVYDTTRRDSLAVPVRISKFPPDKEALSDIELCTSIQSSSNKKSIFYKNTLEVIPNAAKLYGNGLPILYYYTEVYNLGVHQTEPNVTVHTSVIDAFGKEVYGHDKIKPRSHNSVLEIGTVNLSAVKGGTYIFRVSLLDSAKSVLASTAKKFFIYKPGTVLDTVTAGGATDAATSEFAVMTEGDLDRAFERTKYISTDVERDQYQKLTDLKAKQQFMYEFWKRRDPDPRTPENEYKDQYLKRVEYADEHYTMGFHEGWKSDRGRVYITYGACDEVERFPSSAESNPYEIWHYNSIQGGVIFVFVDHNGMGDFILVHSTHRDELHDDNWFTDYAQKMH